MRNFILTLAGILLMHTIVFADAGDSLTSEKNYEMPSITVTSDRATIIRTPVPFSELTKSEIKNTYTTQDMPNILSELPSIIFYSQNGNSIGYSTLTMRGIDQRRISVMLNGIPQNDPEDHIVYWIDIPEIASNLDNVQINRGAGFSSGPLALAGSINMTTTNFVNRKGVRLFSGIGWQEYNSSSSAKYQPITNKQSIEISSGLTGNYAFYGRLSRISSSGYRDRSFSELNSYFLSAVRFDDKLSTQINVFGGPLNDGLAYTGVPKSYISDASLRRKNPSYGGWAYDSTGRNLAYYYERRPQEVEEFSQPHFELLNDWEVNENLNLKSVLFYYQGEGSFDMDGSWIDAAGYRMTKEYGFDSVVNPVNSIYKAFVGNNQWGWLPKVDWRSGKNELNAGLEFRFHRSEHWGRLIYSEVYPKGWDPDYKFYSNEGVRDIFSAFARDRYEIANGLDIIGEIQFNRNSYAIRGEKAGNLFTEYATTEGTRVGNGGEIFRVNFLSINPKLALNYLINDNMNVFALAAFTTRDPRMRNLYAADDAFFGAVPLFEGDPSGRTFRYDFSKPLVKQEKLLDFELGWNLKTNDYLFSANLYYMRFTDELVKSGKLDIVGNPIDGNAPGTLHYGLELSAAAKILSFRDGNVSISANTTISSNKIVDYNFITNTGESVSLKDNEISGFPGMLANIRLSGEFKGLFASVYMRAAGESRTDNFGDMLKNDSRIINHLRADYGGYYDDNILDAYTVFNADLSYTFRNVLHLQDLKIQMQVINLFNKLYAAGAEGKEFFPAAERSIFVGIELGF